MTSRLIKIPAFAAVALFVLLLAALAGIQVFSGTDTAGRLIRQRINRNIAGTVNWETQHLSIIRGQVDVRGISITDPDQQKILAIRNLSADLSLTDLFSGKIVVETVGISKPEVFLTIDSKRRLNLIEAIAAPAGKAASARKSKPPARPLNVRINRLTLKKGKLSLQAEGADSAEVLQNVRLNGIGITIADLNPAEKSGRLSLSVKSGHVSTPETEIPVSGLFLKAALKKGRIDPLNLEIGVPGSHLALSGTAKDIFDRPLMDLKLELSAELSEIRRMLGIDTGLSGSISLRAKASGTPGNPEVFLELDYGGGRLAGTEIGKAAAEIIMKDRKAGVRHLEAALAGGKIKSSGTIDLTRAFADGFTASPADLEAVSYKFDLTAGNVRLSEIPGTTPVSGTLSGRLNLEGTGFSPGSMAARVNAEIRAGGFCPAESIAPLDLQVSAGADLSGNRLGISRFNVAGQGFTLEAGGQYNIAENTLNLDASALIPDLTKLAGRMGIAGLKGEEAKLKADISGPVSRPVVTASIRTKNPGYRDAAAASLEADFKLTGNSPENLRGKITARISNVETGIQPVSAVRLESRIEGSKIYLEPLEISLTRNQDLQARGWVSLEQDYKLKVLLERFDPAALKIVQSKWLDQVKGFTGKITGEIEAEGNAGRIKDTRAHMNISQLKLMFQGDEIASARDLTASLENGEISIPGSRITVLKHGYIDIRGTGNLERQIDITAQGVFPAKLVESVAEGKINTPEGRVSLSARLQGTLKRPDFNAEITLHDLGLTIDRTMQKIHSVNGSLSLTEEQISVSGIAGRIDSGKFSLSGTVDLENFRPARADLALSARALPVEVSGVMDMKLNADLKLSGTPQSASLSGDILLVEGHYFKNVNLNIIERAGEIGRRSRQTSPRDKLPSMDLPFLRNLSLNISVGHRNPFMVDNNLALLSIRPQLNLGGTAENPVVTGLAEITEGTVTYRNTEFEVKKGIIDFINPYRTEPAVDIRAEARVRKWKITLSVTGTPENLDFRLSSSPFEEDADILSLLAVGKTTRELSGTGAGRSPEEMLADLVAGRLEKQIIDGTGLDTVELEYRKNGTSESDNGEVRVTLGKELSRRLSVNYGLETKSGEMVQQTTAVYKLMQSLSASAFQDTEGAFGGELRYRLEFR